MILKEEFYCVCIIRILSLKHLNDMKAAANDPKTVRPLAKGTSITIGDDLHKLAMKKRVEPLKKLKPGSSFSSYVADLIYKDLGCGDSN